MVEPIVELDRIRKQYGDTIAVDRVDLVINRGEFVVLLGPSGSGKTTLLSILGGFTEPTEGRVLIDRTDVTDLAPAQRPTATVFQDYALFPHMDVSRNVAFGLAMHGVPRNERNERVEEVLSLVGLKELGGRAVQQLSGGQQQRVALARAIAIRPTVLLLDEPLGALDLALRRQMQEELVRIQKSVGTTFVHVTHDQDEAMSIADTIIVLNEGRVEDQGSARRVYLNPHSLFAATFMGESNVFPGIIRGTDDGLTAVDTPFGAWDLPEFEGNAAEVWIVLRPEHLRIGPGDNGAVSLGYARITEIVFQGSYVKVLAESELKGLNGFNLHLPQDTDISLSSRVLVHTNPKNVVMLGR